MWWGGRDFFLSERGVVGEVSVRGWWRIEVGGAGDEKGCGCGVGVRWCGVGSVPKRGAH